MRKTILALVAVPLLLLAPPATAGKGESFDWEFGPYAGFGSLDDHEDDDGTAFDPEGGFIAGARVGFFLHPRWSLEASYQHLDAETGLDSSLGLPDQDFDVDSFRFNVLFNFNPGGLFRPFLTAGIGSESLDITDIGDDTAAGLNAGIGLRWFTSEHFAIRADGRYVTVDYEGLDDRQNNLEGTLGLSWTFGGGPPPDTDMDGVPDRKDDCPDTPAGATVDERGCPRDSDEDQVFDGLDNCPDTPSGWPVDETGCPLDTDGDRVPDGKDKCPGTPSGALVDSTGCPGDSDADGVYDGIDQCPDTQHGVSVDARGCPLDTDGDGVFDGIDRCPDTPRGDQVDHEGCTLIPPKSILVLEELKASLVLEGVNFEVDKATLTDDSRLVLDEVAASLLDWPEVRVEVGGHTDSTGTVEHNLELSTQRAQAVVDYLASRGVARSRMVAKGYGQERPIAPNDTQEGKDRNRRVELTRIE